MKTSPAARELIKRFEPFRAEAVQSEDGRWVVGYGHRAAAKAGVKVTEDEAALLLIYDVMRAEEVVDDSITGPLSRSQRDALTSFVHDIGVDRFRGSDVARYLFEGRARAAGEALALFGDGASARREAESSLFLDALMPAKPGQSRKPQSVELVIKVEHPSEERVLEGAIDGDEAPPPPKAYSDLPPPPPPPDAGLARRREAEDEIARILAAVEALPPEVRQDLTETAMAPVADAVSDMRDDPIDVDYKAVEPGDAELEAASDAAASDAAASDEAEAAGPDDGAIAPVEAGAGEETDAQPGDPSAADADPEAAANRVIARMDEEIGETGTALEEAPVGPAACDEPDGEPERPKMAAPIAAFDLPDGMGLGFVLANCEPIAASESAASETGATLAPDAAPVEMAPTLPDHYAMELPKGMGLGYALTSVMEGRLQTADTAAARPAPTDEVRAPATSGANAESEPDTVTGEELEASTDAAPAEIIERAVSLSGDDTPPPHPAEAPAEAVGAVGEVEGEPADPAHSVEPGTDALAGDDPLMDGADPMSDVEADFSPRDLAADVHTTEDRPGPRSDDGMWTFLAVLIAGGLLAGFGSVLAAAEWDHIIAQRELTLNFGMAIAGFFLVIVAGWQLASIWLSKLKQKAGN
ncbi:lysozyme [uncultured Maricaulis sp.]|uniref:lysozyme n=1 Tax=uncultured Maricaulis sp. TaxID=174710 RepID=UPI002613B52C|nr:lysozyme [uncultured Maricaulis sp.]